MKIYKAFYQSRNFSFEAFAATRKEAHSILLAGLKKHADQYNCDPDWFMFGDADGIEIVDYELGKAYRDCDYI